MPDTTNDTVILTRAEAAIETLGHVRDAIGTVILGQDAVIDLSINALLCGGHALLVGAPGLAKTRLVETIATVTGLDEKRIQFTPDLMPADILGAEVLEESESGKRHFRFLPGPVFCQLLMADEINRASPRTQSALLQAMQEHQVTIAGVAHDLPKPFHVLATQNPIEQEGTYPLPEAQLDRFLFQIDIGYPDETHEREILLATTGISEAAPSAVLDAKGLMDLQALVRLMPVGEKTLDAIVALVRLGRPDQSTLDVVKDGVSWGPGPRAGQALMLGVRARALLQGRFAPSVEDVCALAAPVLKHRMALSFAARADGLSLSDLINRMVQEIA
ncbi:MAG: AAA family ATPase [Robiginitomaculum sp.]|nr:MAG: AAA family ATPase [Robiginitomaculum sp.]